MVKVLELQGVRKSFPGFTLDNISFDLPKGYIMGLMGPNGAGKTTTIQLILNILKLNEGQIKLFGLDHQKHEIQIKEDVGVVFDTSFLVDGWKVKDAESALAPFYTKWSSKTFKDLIDKFDLPTDKKIGDFSRGMQMKLMLACALSHDAKLLLLDEPTSGLDAVTRDQLSEILQEYIQDGERSVLFSTHIASDLERIADYITFINNGKLFYSGTLDNLMASYTLVKGNTEVLDTYMEQKLIGLRRTNLGFEGLIDVNSAKQFNNIVLDKVSLDDIVLFASKGDGM